MRIRIRIGQGPRIQRKEGKNRHLAMGAAALLTPASVMAAILGVWRICADIGLTGPFAIPTGLFSHWQVWLAIAALLQLLSMALGRYALKRRTPY
ncbi:MAG: hypothetical protein JNK48_06735 [Bryobacterales bacterium]|nr:hypothetical protein [Bryobacterales bacterium]